MGYLYRLEEYLRPWKLTCLIAGIIVLSIGSIVTPAPDWDIPVTFIMAVSTYVTAPCTVRVFFERKWRLLPVALVATGLSVDGCYSLYWHFRDPNVLALMRSANAQASLPLYALCGVFCLYRGNLKHLVLEVRAAFQRRKAG